MQFLIKQKIELKKIKAKICDIFTVKDIKMKINPKEIDKAIHQENDESYVEEVQSPKVIKMHTPDIAQKRKDLGIYQNNDSKRRPKKPF